VAIETANVVLMKSDPRDIIRAIALSKATVRKMKQNLVWASVYNLYRPMTTPLVVHSQAAGYLQ
jgi:cation transport ATPase